MSDSSKQTVANQRSDCEALARARGYQLVEVYEEGASAAAVRPVFQRMMAQARRRRSDVLVIWALDRFGRSFVYNVLDVADLHRLGVQVVSAKESWLDATSGMVRQILVGILWRRPSTSASGASSASAPGMDALGPRAGIWDGLAARL